MATRLPYTANTATGERFDISFPLHPQTASPMRVSQLVTAVLEALDRESTRVPWPSSARLDELLEDAAGPAIISTDYVCAYAEQIRSQIHLPLTILGTDGYGRSDTREVLRKFFGVDRHHIVVSALKALADEEKISLNSVAIAIETYAIDPDALHPLIC